MLWSWRSVSSPIVTQALIEQLLPRAGRVERRGECHEHGENARSQTPTFCSSGWRRGARIGIISVRGLSYRSVRQPLKRQDGSPSTPTCGLDVSVREILRRCLRRHLQPQVTLRHYPGP